MANEIAAIDTGPLVALFDRDDANHEKTKRFLRRARFDFFSNLAVVTEAAHLLGFDVRVQAQFVDWLAAGAIELVDLAPGDLSRISTLMLKYYDLPMDFADATLVALCERLEIETVATFDRDFSVYRLHDQKPFRNVIATA
jgi:predicted nucleic acid-binding protein